eukprot:TRINITY_DN20983_c0_g1_i1.p1 TRINITY_DN20983_c0_g1~~TRINITY_DN20983_c0_g1_i1.p1  ORF type:complete len:268 (-),score=29.96 TRINITY_DN20983_c0_g1_i1:345-1148(-)
MAQSSDGDREYMPLRCNYPTRCDSPGREGSQGRGGAGAWCNKPLSGEAWATSCSHIFCARHAREWFKTENRCPVCLDREGVVRVAKVHAHGESLSKVQSLLVGLAPMEIQLAYKSALHFWVQHKYASFLQEHEDEVALVNVQKRLVGSGRKRLTEVDSVRKSLVAGRDELKHQLGEAERELATRRQDIASQRAQLSKLRLAYREAQSRAAGLTPRNSREPDESDFEFRRTMTPPAIASRGSASRGRPAQQDSAPRSRSRAHVGLRSG